MSFFRRILGGRDKAAAQHAVADPDALTLQQLQRAGADLSLPRETLHYLLRSSAVHYDGKVVSVGALLPPD